MKRLLTLSIIALFAILPAAADEGMWLLPFLNRNMKDMKSLGLKLKPNEIYNVNGNSLKDAVVIFGGGCTGEIVSPEGLLFTNHHCGYSSIQSLSSVEHDYLKYGFWARSRAEEIPAPGLTVTFIRHIEEVTDRVMAGTDISMSNREMDSIVQKNSRVVIDEYKEKHSGMNVTVSSFFGRNQYILFVKEIYTDIRLVGTPPSSIGKFGGETDNWMWPRHTGDFSIFRVYAGKDNKPAAYSKENVPYQAPIHLKISLKGYKEGDFAMVMGFPGSTERYITSYEIDELLNITNPNMISIRGKRQNVLEKEMAASDEIRIKYANKYVGSSNYWKNAIGMSRGLKKLGIKAEKEQQEQRFTEWANASPGRAVFRDALPIMRRDVESKADSRRASVIIGEAITRGTDMPGIASRLRNDLYRMRAGDIGADEVKKGIPAVYKDYDENVERKVAKVMYEILIDSLPDALPEDLVAMYENDFGRDVGKLVDYIYDKSVFSNPEKIMDYIEKGDLSELNNDPAIYISGSLSLYNRRKAAEAASGPDTRSFSEGYRLYIAGILEMEKDQLHYPDANFTIRLTYGNILPYKPADAVFYDYYTTLSGVMGKEDPENPVEFEVPQKLKELYHAKDFGRYAYKGDVPVAFISNNDITGGNSGSPVLNRKGELIGLAFDGNWEAMSGDIAFEHELQRTISVDIRYVLFIIDKFADAGYLLNEMTIVK